MLWNLKYGQRIPVLLWAFFPQVSKMAKPTDCDGHVKVQSSAFNEGLRDLHAHAMVYQYKHLSRVPKTSARSVSCFRQDIQYGDLFAGSPYFKIAIGGPGGHYISLLG